MGLTSKRMSIDKSGSELRDVSFVLPASGTPDFLRRFREAGLGTAEPIDAASIPMSWRVLKDFASGVQTPQVISKRLGTRLVHISHNISDLGSD